MPSGNSFDPVIQETEATNSVVGVMLISIRSNFRCASVSPDRFKLQQMLEFSINEIIKQFQILVIDLRQTFISAESQL